MGFNTGLNLSIGLQLKKKLQLSAHLITNKFNFTLQKIKVCMKSRIEVKQKIIISPTVHCIIESFHCSSFHVTISAYMKVHEVSIALKIKKKSPITSFQIGI